MQLMCLDPFRRNITLSSYHFSNLEFLEFPEFPDENDENGYDLLTCGNVWWF